MILHDIFNGIRDAWYFIYFLYTAKVISSNVDKYINILYKKDKDKTGKYVVFQ